MLTLVNKSIIALIQLTSAHVGIGAKSQSLVKGAPLNLWSATNYKQNFISKYQCLCKIAL